VQGVAYGAVFEGALAGVGTALGRRMRACVIMKSSCYDACSPLGPRSKLTSERGSRSILVSRKKTSQPSMPSLLTWLTPGHESVYNHDLVGASDPVIFEWARKVEFSALVSTDCDFVRVIKASFVVAETINRHLKAWTAECEAYPCCRLTIGRVCTDDMVKLKRLAVSPRRIWPKVLIGSGAAGCPFEIS
jgi:hypothetical protein